MTYDPFRNRMDDDEDMPRGYKPKPVYSEHVEICLDDEKDGDEICDLIDDRLKQVCSHVHHYYKHDVLNFDSYDDRLWYEFEGTENELAEMRKAIRRLSRGKPRFAFVFEVMD